VISGNNISQGRFVFLLDNKTSLKESFLSMLEGMLMLNLCSLPWMSKLDGLILKWSLECWFFLKLIIWYVIFIISE
jgi:hypothetical protein